MSFSEILADLLAHNEDAVGVLFVDESGETVDLASSDASPFQMKVVGAYVGIYLRQMREFLADAGIGEPRWVHVEKESLHLYVQPLPEGYYLVLVQRAPALVARARRTLAVAAQRLTRELFSAA